jgi:hypothetical protein
LHLEGLLCFFWFNPANKRRDLQDFLDRSVLRGKIMMPAQLWFFYIYENNEVRGMNEVEKAKKILGIGFLGSISVAVESLKLVIDNMRLLRNTS